LATIAVTGISGCLGRNLLAQLEVDPEVDLVLGLDVAAPPPGARKLVFARRCVGEPFAELWAEHGVDVGIHLAFDAAERDPARREAINVGGARNFLAACAAAGAATVTLVSSGEVYGPRVDAPLLFEASALAAPLDYGPARDKLRAEELCFEFAKDNPEVQLQIVRPCPVVGGPSANPIVRLCESPLLLGPRHLDPAFQFLHVDDATRALYRLVKRGETGIFNLAAEGRLTLSQVAQLSERRLLRLPLFALRLLMRLGWRLGLEWLAPAPPSYLDYWVHPGWLVGTKLQHETLFSGRYDSGEAYLAHLEAAAEAARPAE